MARLLLTCLLLTTLLIGACGDSRLPQYELSGSTMGTTYNVLLVAPADDVAMDAVRDDISATLQAIDDLASTWRDDSELSRFNASPESGWIAVSAEFCDAIERSLEVSRQSGGAFDVTIGPLVNLWGFGPGGEASEPPANDALLAAMQRVGYERLAARCDKPAVRKAADDMFVDLSGWAKGHAADEVASLLDRKGIENYLVEIGGEMRVRGQNSERRKWAVAIEAPSTTRRTPHFVLRVTDTGVATSGDYRNYFDHEGRHYSHTIDARTGRPISHNLAAVTVVSESAAYADAMATALLVLGPDAGPRLAESLGIAACFLIRHKTGIEELTTAKFDILRNL